MTEISPKREATAIWIGFAAAVCVMLAHLAVSRTYSNWFWGLNHFYFLGRLPAAAIAGIGCILCLPWVWRVLTVLYIRIGRMLRRVSAPAAVGDLVVAGVLGVLFWMLRMPRHFLGDGRLLIRSLEQGTWFHHYEPLDRLVHFLVLKVTRPLFGFDAGMVYTLVSIAAGVIFVLAALRLGSFVRQKFFITFYLLTLGVVQLFLGYAESYSLATAAMLVYMVLALEHLAGKRSLAWPGLALLVGVALHHTLLFLVPSFVYLVLAGARGDRRKGVRAAIPGIGFLAGVAVLVIATSLQRRATGVSLLFVPWTEIPVAQYTMISWEHLLDFLNEQILVSPLAWVIALVFAVAFLKVKQLRQSAKFRFLFLVGTFPILFGVLLRPGLGGSRDWDLWSMSAFPYAVAGAVWLSAYLGDRRDVKYLAYAVVVVGFVHTIPWVVVNKSPDLSTERFARMSANNPLWTEKRIAAARPELASSYMERGMPAEAVLHLEEAVKHDPSKGRYLHDLGIAYGMLRKFDPAEDRITRALHLDPMNAEAHADLGQIYLIMNRLEEAERELRQAVKLDPSLAAAHFNLGRLDESRGDQEGAAEAYGRAVEAKPNVARYWHRLVVTLERIPGREADAKEAWGRIADLTKGDPAAAEIHEEALRRSGRQ
jgi:tetratricopeptide (TPR) repeat protein